MDNTKRNLVALAIIFATGLGFGINWQVAQTVQQSNCVEAGKSFVDGDCK